jgi:hypothetical protein
MEQGEQRGWHDHPTAHNIILTHMKLAPGVRLGTCEIVLSASSAFSARDPLLYAKRHSASSRSIGFFAYSVGNERIVSGQQYSSSFASPRRRPTSRT